MKQRIWNFHGGIHPPEHKKVSTRQPIRIAPLADKFVLPLQQHLGQPAIPLVAVGDWVLKGQMIAAAQGYISAPVHAPTSGQVTAIEDLPIPHPSGLTAPCIVIKPDGKDSWAPLTPIVDYRQHKPGELLQIINDAGITGLGGAGFPTAVKLNPSQDIHIDTLIINAAECEPYITADDMLMRERADQVIQGIEIIRYLLDWPRCVIGIEDNKPQAAAALRQSIETSDLTESISIAVVPTKYPSGGEKQLIQLLTGREVPSGAIPADLGIVCQNVGTAAAIFRAIHFGEPLISRITTLTGDAIKDALNMEVLIGTPIAALLELCGLQAEQLHRLIMGGPMMGFTLTDPAVPVIKTTNCILAATLTEFPDPEPEQPCIRCGMCAQVCPASLLPQQLYWFSKAREFDKALSHNLIDCIECGACSYVCPSNIPLVQYYRFAKGEIRQEELNHTKAEQSRQRFEARKDRLAQQAAEKEAKKKARAAQTAKKAGGSEPDNKSAAIQAALERAKAKKARNDNEQLPSDLDRTGDNKTLVNAPAETAAADNNSKVDN